MNAEKIYQITIVVGGEFRTFLLMIDQNLMPDEVFRSPNSDAARAAMMELIPDSWNKQLDMPGALLNVEETSHIDMFRVT